MSESRAVHLAYLLALAAAGCSPHVEEDRGEPTVERIGLPMPAPRAAAAVNSSLSHRIEAALKNVRDRDLLTTNSFWTIFHGILGSGPEATLLDPLTHRRVNAIDYICQGGSNSRRELNSLKKRRLPKQFS